ncbi:MAG: metallophosphoesterase family protein [Candidatus ainarchaeum sp.]|nr:metallophosphoesterase family protein [Candidatus ainarchaeum sp.]
MRILAFSDLHGDEAALESLKRLAPDYDHLFGCGDFSHSVSFAEEAMESLPNCLCIPGNWDNAPVSGLLSSGQRSVHNRRVELGGGLNAVGFGYSIPTPFGTYGERSEAEFLSSLSKLPIDSNTLLLLHCPPKGHFDEVRGGRHAGSESILEIIRQRKPFAALFGHIHEHSGTELLGQTTLVKLPAASDMRACSIELAGRKISAEFISL